MADSRKRRQTKSFDGQVHPKKRFDFSSVTGFRFLIPSKAAGSMIGKGGEVIKRLRSEFSCRIMVPDSEGPERMVIMDGSIDTIADVWNDVLPSIKDSVNAKECDFKNSGSRQVENDTEIDLRLVVHESQAGALIGKGGERIRSLIENHKMTIIKIYPTLCPNSTDRVVRMVSSQENLLACLKSTLKLLENQIVKGIRTDYDPDNFDESIAPNYGGFLSKDNRFQGRGYGAKPGGMRNNDGFDDFMPRNNVFDRVNAGHFDEEAIRTAFFGGPGARAPGSGVNDLLDGIIRLHGSNDMQKHVSRVALPVHLVNAVIGTDGHRLSDIKRDSGAHVQLDDERLNEREELFLIRGTPDQIYKAQCLMQLCARKYGDVGMYGY